MGCNVDKFELMLSIERSPDDKRPVSAHMSKKRTSGPIVKIVNGHAIVVREQETKDESSN